MIYSSNSAQNLRFYFVDNIEQIFSRLLSLFSAKDMSILVRSRLTCGSLQVSFVRGDTMNKKDLWDIFIKTGSVSDYLRYRKAADYGDERDTSWEEQTEIAEEFLGDLPYEEN